MASTYYQAANTLLHLPTFTQQCIAQLNANFDEINWVGAYDVLGYPTNDTVSLIASFLGPNELDFALRMSVYIALKTVFDECRIILGLPVAPTLTTY